MNELSRVMPVWTKEQMDAWVKDRRDGVQYRTPYGPVYCPPRNWEEKK